MPENPAISVVIPTYNAAKFLREALDSLVAQTFADWEAVCVNDGSTDNSLEILQEYAAKDARFRILDGPNGGYGKAMNRGMEAARGKYMAILEPDDYLPPNAYAVLHAMAEQHGLDIAKGNFCSFYGEGAGRWYRPNLSVVAGQAICPRREPKCFYFSMHTWTCLYDMDFLRRHGIRHHETPGAAYQDNGWYMLTFAYAERLMCTRDVVYYYREDNPDSSIRLFADDKKMHAMGGEYAYSRRILEQTPEVWKQVEPAWVWRRWFSHLFTMERLLPEDKLRYLEAFREELKGFRKMDDSMLDGHARQQVQEILISPEMHLFCESMAARQALVPRPFTLRRRLLNLFWARRNGGWELRFMGFPVVSVATDNGVRRTALFGRTLATRSVPVDLGIRRS